MNAPPPADDDKLLNHRVRVLEDAQRDMSEALSSLNHGFTEFRAEASAYTRAALFVFGVVHPFLVGVVVYVATH